MLTLYTTDAYTQSILPDEVCRAISIGESAIMESAIDVASKELYALERSGCGSLENASLCLFFYTYALESWCATGTLNHISEAQLIALLSCIEQTSKTCCNE